LRTLRSPVRVAAVGGTTASDAEASAGASAPAEGAVYEGVFEKPLGVKFTRGNDGGAYVISKSADPAYDQFEVGDKILEIRRVTGRGLRTSTVSRACRGGRAVGAQWKSPYCTGNGVCGSAHTSRVPPHTPLVCSASFGPEVWKAENYGQGAWP